MKEILFAPRIVLFHYSPNTRIGLIFTGIVISLCSNNGFGSFRPLVSTVGGVHYRSPPVLQRQPPTKKKLDVMTSVEMNKDEYSFLYAATSDSHKNFECICRAAVLLQQKMPELKFKVYITVKGDENAYTRWLYSHWGDVPALAFIGYLSKEQLYAYYQQSNCLIFASKVETWGLPITEFAVFNKPMLLSDLPYAHETAAGCEQVAFFHPDRPWKLAAQMAKLLQGENSFLTALRKEETSPPVAES